MPCVCFTMFVAPEKMPRYVAMHATPWPELLRELHSSGWRNYSLFLRADGLLFGYWESSDPSASMTAMARSAVSARWSTEMDELVVPGTHLRYLDNTSTRGTSNPAAFRSLAVGESARALVNRSNHDDYLAEFLDSTGRPVVYSESLSNGIAEQSPFVEVFNLDLLLSTLH